MEHKSDYVNQPNGHLNAERRTRRYRLRATDLHAPARDVVLPKQAAYFTSCNRRFHTRMFGEIVLRRFLKSRNFEIGDTSIKARETQRGTDM